MRALIWGFGIATIVSAGPATAGAATTSSATDAQLRTRIEHRLSAVRALRNDHIRVDVDHHVATLSGRVDSRAERREAERLAHLRGIARVNDELSVATRATTGSHASERVTGTTGTIESSTKQGATRTGEVISDGWITGHVKSRFIGEDRLKGSHINVDTNDHVVTLKGTVASAAGRTRAVELARSTDGVHRVVDELVVARDHR